MAGCSAFSCPRPTKHFDDLKAELAANAAAAQTLPEAMKALRVFKSEARSSDRAVRYAGICRSWRWTARLTDCADLTVPSRPSASFSAWPSSKAIGRRPIRRTQTSATASIVLAMGKHGAFELNYYLGYRSHHVLRAGAAGLREGLEATPFMVRITRDLVRLMEERTGNSYVFRTDLRLRRTFRARRRSRLRRRPRSTTTRPWARTGSAPPSSRPSCRWRHEAGERFLAELVALYLAQISRLAAIADVHR